MTQRQRKKFRKFLKWLTKANKEAHRRRTTIVALLPHHRKPANRWSRV